MNLLEVTERALGPAFGLLPSRMDSPEARVMLLAIGLQESRFEYRRQLGNGPARGFWQFERGGGVAGVIRHKSSRYWAHDLCAERGVPFETRAVWTALEYDDVLAAGFARLLLFTDAFKLPAIGDEGAAWELYADRTWKPGKPHPQTWPGFYARAVSFVTKGA